MTQPLVWAEIDLSAIAENTRELRRITRPEARLMAVVKADAYGHGAAEVARTAMAAGASVLGVARLGEAISLRQAGISAPILIFSYTAPQDAEALVRLDLAQSVFDVETAMAFSQHAVTLGQPIHLHLKVDTGMGRLGIFPDNGPGVPVPSEAVAAARTIAALPGIILEGLSTHFAAADSADKDFTHRQFTRFTAFIDRLTAAGVHIPIKHAANSAAIIDHPETHLDMVRAGIALYGLRPSNEVNLSRLRLTPAMTLKSRIVQLKCVGAGFTVSYGMTWTAKRPTAIATVPVGYADGFSRRLSNIGEMLVHGRRAPIRGRVCMDHTMIDVGDIPEARTGDEVVIFGRQNGAEISAEAVAEQLGTINYEVTSALTSRVQRIFV
ncbi:MAG: alanine racemase [Pseudomonadota bacterium]